MRLFARRNLRRKEACAEVYVRACVRSWVLVVRSENNLAILEEGWAEYRLLRAAEVVQMLGSEAQLS